jgi:hypothetical protein
MNAAQIKELSEFLCTSIQENPAPITPELLAELIEANFAVNEFCDAFEKYTAP